MARPFPAHPSPPVVALVLAGGRGGRLMPLTEARAKPAVPFAGSYRIIDVVLSNLMHSKMENVWIAEQYRPFTLNRHLAGGRPWDFDSTRHGFQILPPAEGRSEEGFAAGNGHSLHQQVPLLQSFGAETVVVLSADHLYHLDLRPVIAQHLERGSELTVVTTEISEDPSRYGVVQVHDGAVTRYDYKPESPEGQLVATEIFVYQVSALAAVTDDLVQREKAAEERAAARGEDSEHDPRVDGDSLGDYGESIIPAFVARGKAHEYRLDGYWRDIGTIDAFYQAHMELVRGEGLELNRPEWPVVTNPREVKPAWIGPSASVVRSLVSPGASVEGSVEDSVIGPGVAVERGAQVRRSVLLGDCTVPAGARLEAVIADVGADIPEGSTGESKPGPGNITVLVPGQRRPASPADETTGP